MSDLLWTCVVFWGVFWSIAGPVSWLMWASLVHGKRGRLSSEEVFDRLQDHYGRVGVTPALREAYERYRAACGDKDFS